MEIDGTPQRCARNGYGTNITGDVVTGLNATIAAIDERTKHFATREDLKDLKDEILQAVDTRLSTSTSRTDDLIKWAIGTVCTAALTLIVAIVGASISAYSAFTEKTVSTAGSAKVLHASPEPQRVEIVITVNGEEVKTNVKK